MSLPLNPSDAIQTSFSSETKSYSSPPPPLHHPVPIQTMKPDVLTKTVCTLNKLKSKEKKQSSPLPITNQTSVNLKTPAGKGTSDQQGSTKPPVISPEQDKNDNEYGEDQTLLEYIANYDDESVFGNVAKAAKVVQAADQKPHKDCSSKKILK